MLRKKQRVKQKQGIFGYPNLDARWYNTRKGLLSKPLIGRALPTSWCQLYSKIQKPIWWVMARTEKRY